MLNRNASADAAATSANDPAADPNARTPSRAAAPAATFNLPDPRHIARLPSPLSAAQVERIRQQAYALPQVVKPADFGLEAGADAEARLDRLGLVLLQKAAAGARPSRWIAPEQMDDALRHLDAVGTGPAARAALVERGAALEALGISRDGTGWRRLITLALPLAPPAGPINVARLGDVSTAAVWAFFRDGDRAALQGALGGGGPWPHAAELAAHLNALVARSESGHPRHLDALLARLQAECATPAAVCRAEKPRAAASRNVGNCVRPSSTRCRA